MDSKTDRELISALEPLVDKHGLPRVVSATEVRHYPPCCQSWICGKINCGKCKNLDTLEEFKRWVQDSNAVPLDPTRSPGTYISRATEDAKDKDKNKDIKCSPKNNS